MLGVRVAAILGSGHEDSWSTFKQRLRELKDYGDNVVQGQGSGLGPESAMHVWFLIAPAAVCRCSPYVSAWLALLHDMPTP